MKYTCYLVSIISLLALAPGCVMDEADRDGAGTAELSSELSVSGSLYSLPARGGSGGAASSLNCAPDYVAVGIYGRSGRYIDRLGLTCAPLHANGSLGPSYDTGSLGGNGGSSFRLGCPSGTAIVGVYGRSGRYLDQIGLACSGVAHWRNHGTVQYYSTSAGGSGGGYFEDLCPIAYVGSRLNVRTGRYADREQLVCAYINP